MDFRKKILSLIDVPVGRVSFRNDKWGTLVTVYFNGIASSVSIGDDMLDDCLEEFLHSVKNGSELMIKEAKACFGEKWNENIKYRK